MRHFIAVLVCAAPILTAVAPRSASAASLRVPAQAPSIQAAVDAASAGDVIYVHRGRYCGATIDKPVKLVGLGSPVIEGCADGPTLANGARIGFFLPGEQGESPAAGTSIRGFAFDGEGVSNADLTPLAFGVFGRFVDDVVVADNRFYGTVQAVTNTAGDRWHIAHNAIEGLTLFDCTGLCTGGDGIVIQPARGAIAVPGGPESPENRPESNYVGFNRITGAVPDGFDVFSMAGILVFLADDTTVVRNTVRLRDNPDADAVGQGIVVTNTCCGLTTPLLPGARDTTIAFNDVSRSEVGIIVEGEGGANTEGLVVRHNRGTVEIEGVLQPRPARPHRPHRPHRWKHRWY